MQVMMRVEQISKAGPSTPVNLSVMFHSVTNSIVARAAFGKKRKNAAEFMAAIKSGVGLASGFNIPDLFPTWTTVLAKLTGMKRSLQGVHKTVDAFLEEMINEWNAARADKMKVGCTEKVDENLFAVLIGRQERGGLGCELAHGVEQRGVRAHVARRAAAEQFDDSLVALVEVVELVLALLQRHLAAFLHHRPGHGPPLTLPLLRRSLRPVPALRRRRRHRLGLRHHVPIEGRED